MNDAIKTFLAIILLTISLLSCKKDLSPIVTDVAIYYTGENQNNLYEFRVSNTSDESVWYWGYEERSPVFQWSVYNNESWENSGPGWCGTGLFLVELEPDDSFLLKITRPDNNLPWRAGIQILRSAEDEGEIVWSEKID